MFRLVIALLSTALVACASTRLYLKDGTYQLVREFQVQEDRVHYYSTERADWEDIPLDLVDLKRTQGEAKAREEAEKEDAAALAAEDKAERAMSKEVGQIPIEPGAYMMVGSQVKTLPLAESKVVGDKKRSILKAMSPIPIVSGKGTLEIDGLHSKTVVDNAQPEFYIRLTREERFGMLRLSDHKGNRVVEELNIIPVSGEIIEKQDEVAVFRKQVGDALFYKIWPMKPLEPGEYAVVEFTPSGDNKSLNIMSWDFSWPGKR